MERRTSDYSKQKISTLLRYASIKPEGKKIRQHKNASILPDDIMLKVMGYLQPEDLINCSGVCKQWRSTSRDNVLWKAICLRSYNAKSSNKREQIKDNELQND